MSDVNAPVPAHLFGRAATLIAFSRDEVTRFDRDIGGLVSKDALLDLSVGFGRAGVLAQVFGPRLDEKALDVSPGLSDVLEQEPPRCPVASPQPTEICHSAAERVGLGGIDPIGDLHQHWALLGLGARATLGAGQSAVGCTSSASPEASDQRVPPRVPRSTAALATARGSFDARGIREDTPDQTPQRKAALKSDLVGRKATRANPVR